METFELATVRGFAADLKARRERCDNGEGMMCSTIEESVNHYCALLEELRTAVNHWARAVFTKRSRFDAEVESTFKQAAKELLQRSKKVAALGRSMDGQCYILQRLNELHCRIADIDYLLENWVSPQPAIGPAPREKMPPVAGKLIAERFKSL